MNTPYCDPGSPLFVLVRDTLMSEWDPIGVRGNPNAADEYDQYVPHVCRLLLRNPQPQLIAEHLLDIQRVYMGLKGNPTTAQRAAEELIRRARLLNLPT